MSSKETRDLLSLVKSAFILTHTCDEIDAPIPLLLPCLQTWLNHLVIHYGILFPASGKDSTNLFLSSWVWVEKQLTCLIDIYVLFEYPSNAVSNVIVMASHLLHHPCGRGRTYHCQVLQITGEFLLMSLIQSGFPFLLYFTYTLKHLCYTSQSYANGLSYEKKAEVWSDLESSGRDLGQIMKASVPKSVRPRGNLQDEAEMCNKDFSDGFWGMSFFLKILLEIILEIEEIPMFWNSKSCSYILL